MQNRSALKLTKSRLEISIEQKIEPRGSIFLCNEGIISSIRPWG